MFNLQRMNACGYGVITNTLDTLVEPQLMIYLSTIRTDKY